MASPPVDNGSPEEKQVSAYYVNRLLRDLRKNPAELFIDATGPTSWFLTNPKYFGYEQFPEVSAFVRAHYVHLVDLYGQRYFLRRDLAARRELAFSQPLPVKSCTTEALRCIDNPVTLPRTLPPVRMPRHALLQAEFMPVMPQIGYATVFSNEAKPNSFQGFQFQHVTGDRYRLVLGLGDQRIISKELLLPQGKPATLALEFDENLADIRCNGASVDQLRLPHPVADSPGPITLDSWIDGARVFSGKIQFFQITDLDRSR